MICSPQANEGSDDDKAQAKILACLHNLKPQGGPGDFISALRTAHLALKFRKSTVGGQRIVIFAGSPVTATPEALKKW